MPPDFLPSPSVPSASEAPPVRFSFLVPRLLKNDERRLPFVVSGETGVVVGVVAGAVSVVVAGALVSRVGAVSFTTLPVWGAGEVVAASVSLAGTAGAGSWVAVLVVGVVVEEGSFLPKSPPKIELRLFALGAVSRAVVVAGVSGAAVGTAASVAATDGSSVLLSPVGTTGFSITREAILGQPGSSK